MWPQVGNRALAFEQCEPRIALSTTSASAYAGDATLVHEGGFIPLGRDNLASYVDLKSFVVTPSSAGLNASLRFDDTPHTFELFQNADLVDRDFTSDVAEAFDSGSPTISGGHDSRPFQSVRGVAQVTPIPPPMADGHGSEGGQIAMTAFMSPAGLGLPNSAPSLVAAKAKALSESQSADPSVGPSNSSPIEGLRARAIVYEVAQREHKTPDASEANSAPLVGWDKVPPEPFASSASGGTSSQPTAAINPAPGAEVAPKAGHAVHSSSSYAAALDAEPLPPFVERDAAAEVNSVGAVAVDASRDAAFAGWDDETTPVAPESDLAAPAGETRSRKILGAALMVVLGSHPLSRLLRRRTQPAAVEQLPPQRRRHSVGAV